MIKILGKLYERNPIQVSEQQASKDSNPEKWEAKRWDLYVIAHYCAWGKFSVRTLEGDPRQSQVELFSLGDSAVNLGMTRWLELTSQSIGEKEDAPKDNCWQLQKSHPQALG